MNSLGLMMLVGLAMVGADREVGASEFRWSYGPPVVEARAAGGWDWISMKDPSIVRYGDKWHLFCTVRGPTRSHAIVYLSFSDFSEANKAERHVLSCHPGYFCAPQVFYFTPQKKWYLICQAADEAWGEPAYRPAFSTTTDIGDPNSWTKLQPMYDTKPENITGWLDFWVICDEAKAHLFFTSLDGKMWRAETSLAEFPKGWSTPQVVLTGGHLRGQPHVPARGAEQVPDARRGPERPRLAVLQGLRRRPARRRLAAAGGREGRRLRLDAERDAGADRWTDVVSHIELLRSGHDEKLEVDPANLRFIFQGVLEKDRQGKAYGAIPWKLGLMEPAK